MFGDSYSLCKKLPSSQTRMANTVDQFTADDVHPTVHQISEQVIDIG
jgi:hypothetical protein